MIRHIKKFNNAAEMQAAIASGAIAAPYIAFESSSNIMNMTIAADKEPASIDYSHAEPADASIRLLGSINRTVTTDERDNVATDLDFTASIKPYDGEEDFSVVNPIFYFIQKYEFDDFVESQSSKYPDWSRNQLIWNYIDDDMYNYVAEPDDTPDQWDSSVHFTCNSMATPLQPEEVEGDMAKEYTWILVGIYSDDGDITWGQEYPGDDKVFELGEIFIPVYSPVTLDSSILYELGHAPYDEFPEYEAKLKIGSYTDNFSEEGYSDLKMMFVSKNGFMNIMNDGNSVRDTIAFFLNDNASDATWTLDLDSSTQGYYVTSWYTDGTTGSDDYDCMYMPNASQDVYEEDLDMYTYYLIAGHYFLVDEEYSNYALSCGVVGSFTLPYYLENNPANIWKYGNLEKRDNNGTIEYWFNAQVTPNSCYPKFAIGLYSQEAFETAYEKSGTSDSSIEYLNTYQSDGLMLEFNIEDTDSFEDYAFDFGGSFDLEDIAGYSEGDTICMALWFLDENDDIEGNVTYVTKLEEEEETPDVSLGYIFTVGQDNTAYFNTGYIPGTNTVVQIKGIMKKSNNGNEHGMATSERGVYQFGIFGFHYPYSNTIYFDHEGYWVSCSAELSDVDSATHEYEFGNFYIKVDGTQVATVTPISSTNSNNKEFYIFASNNMDSDGVKGYAPVGASIEYVKFLEPDASGNLQLMADFRPGIIWPDETKVLQDQVSGDIIYPDGLYNAIEATAITVPDSSIDSSTDYAYLSNYEDWGQEPMYGYVYPTLYIHREDASMNGFQVGLFATDDTSVGVPAGYNSMDEYYADMCGDYIIEILGTDSSTALSDLYMDPSIGYTYVGRFVNYEISYDEWENPHYQINDSGTWIILGSYPPPVEATYLSVSGWDPDTENDTCPCVPHLSGDTSYYDMVGFTIIGAASMDEYMDIGGDLENVSPSDDPEVCISYFNNAWGVAPDYTCASDSSADLAGTLDDWLPNTGSGTETYYVFAYPVHYDSGNDSYEVYIDTDINGEPQNTPWGWCDVVTWGTEAAAPYTCPNCGVGLDFEPDENNPCPDCNYPLNE